MGPSAAARRSLAKARQKAEAAGGSRAAASSSALYPSVGSTNPRGSMACHAASPPCAWARASSMCRAMRAVQGRAATAGGVPARAAGASTAQHEKGTVSIVSPGATSRVAIKPRPAPGTSTMATAGGGAKEKETRGSEPPSGALGHALPPPRPARPARRLTVGPRRLGQPRQQRRPRARRRGHVGRRRLGRRRRLLRLGLAPAIVQEPGGGGRRGAGGGGSGRAESGAAVKGGARRGRRSDARRLRRAQRHGASPHVGREQRGVRATQVVPRPLPAAAAAAMASPPPSPPLPTSPHRPSTAGAGLTCGVCLADGVSEAGTLDCCDHRCVWEGNGGVGGERD